MIWGGGLSMKREREGRRGAYIEDSDGILGPLNADLTILRVNNILDDKAKQRVAFLFLETDNVRSICG